VVALNIPALRERAEDIGLLSAHFMARFNRIYHRSIRGLSPEAARIFAAYPWPGNVRELENLLERIFILEDEDEVLPRHLPDRILRTVRAGLQSVPPIPDPVTGSAPDLDAGFHEQTAVFQHRLIEAALARAQGNLQLAADALHLSRHALRHQMIKLGFSRG
jgi:DNA-binding NtrC family response regulator